MRTTSCAVLGRSSSAACSIWTTVRRLRVAGWWGGDGGAGDHGGSRGRPVVRRPQSRRACALESIARRTHAMACRLPSRIRCGSSRPGHRRTSRGNRAHSASAAARIRTSCKTPRGVIPAASDSRCSKEGRVSSAPRVGRNVFLRQAWQMPQGGTMRRDRSYRGSLALRVNQHTLRVAVGEAMSGSLRLAGSACRRAWKGR